MRSDMRDSYPNGHSERRVVAAPAALDAVLLTAVVVEVVAIGLAVSPSIQNSMLGGRAKLGSRTIRLAPNIQERCRSRVATSSSQTFLPVCRPKAIGPSADFEWRAWPASALERAPLIYKRLRGSKRDHILCAVWYASAQGGPPAPDPIPESAAAFRAAAIAHVRWLERLEKTDPSRAQRIMAGFPKAVERWSPYFSD